MNNQSEKSKLAEFGFITLNKLSPEMDSVIADSANDIANAMGLDPISIGTGIRVSESEKPQIQLDEMLNLIDLKVSKPFNRVQFAYSWALALQFFGFIDNSDEAIRELMHVSISLKEANDRITTRWKNTEIGIQNTLESIFSTVEDDNKKQRAIRAFHGVIDGAMVHSTEGATMALRTLSKDAEALGCEVSTEHATLLAMLLGLRGDCSVDIQKLQCLNDGVVRAPIAYYSRMNDLAQVESDDDIIDSAPAVAISAYIAFITHQVHEHHDARMLPTHDELREIADRIPAFTNAIQSRLTNDVEDSSRKSSFKM